VAGAVQARLTVPVVVGESAYMAKDAVAPAAAIFLPREAKVAHLVLMQVNAAVVEKVDFMVEGAFAARVQAQFVSYGQAIQDNSHQLM